MSASATAQAITPVSRTRHAVLAVFMQMIIGVIYTYPLLLRDLKETDLHPYQYCLAMVAVGAFVGGRWSDHKSPSLVGSVGGLLFGAGGLISAYGVGGQTTSFGFVEFGYGILGGFGAGLAYAATIANLVKWYPDRRGKGAGIAVMGSGLTYGFWVTLISVTLPRTNIRFTFVMIAVVFLVCVGLGARFFTAPPEGWRPPGWKPPAFVRSRETETSSKEMLGTWEFWALWAIFCLGAGVWLTANAKAPALVDGIQGNGVFDMFNRLFGADGRRIFVFGVAGLCSGIARLVWGWLSDRIGREQTISVVAIVSALACVTFLRRGSDAGLLLLPGIWLAAFADGGYAAVMPAMLGDYFGPSTFGGKYGILFSAWGLSGLMWPSPWLFAPTKANPAVLFSAARLPILAGAVLIISLALMFLRSSTGLRSKVRVYS